MSKQCKMHNILFITSKEKSSYDIVQAAYHYILEQKVRIKMYSLDHLGKNFDEVIPMEANAKNLGLIDCVIVVGENETLMNLVRCYQFMNTPPILGIGNGCGPGLYNYTRVQAMEILQIALQALKEDKLINQELMKIACNINCQAMGESICQIEIHRAMDQPILILNIFLENDQKCKIKIGQLRGDGLLVSTPMGSYCKSLSLNGPLMCKTMESIMITPICPLSMKFRPICLPATARIFIEIDGSCRTNSANIFFDENQEKVVLKKGDLLRIKMSRWRAKLISELKQSGEQLFIKSLKNIIRWGENYEMIEMQQMKRKTISSFEGQNMP